MSPTSRLLAPVLALALLSAAPSPSTSDLPAELAALEQGLASELGRYAAWCQESGLLTERRRALELVLAHAPDDAAAHKGLGHVHAKDSSWKPPAKPPGKDSVTRDDPEHAAEIPARRSEAVAGFRDEALRVLDADPEAAAELRPKVFAWILAVDPDDAEVHRRLGEARFGTHWVLAETARAYDRRPELREIVARCVAKAGEDLAPSADVPDDALGVHWNATVRTSAVLVRGTGTRDEALRTLQACHATRDVFRELFRTDTKHTRNFTVYLIADPGADKEPFLASLPDLTDDEREFLGLLVGTGIPRTGDVVQWDASEPRRLDGAVRHTLGGLLRDGFGVTTAKAWAWEGIGLYLTREIVGTRLTWYIQPQDRGNLDAARIRAELLGTRANWMNSAYELLKSASAPPLAEVMSCDVNTMGIADLLAAYALSAYLLEGRPDEVAEVLVRTGQGELPAQVVGQVLGLSIEELGPRLVRWLSERLPRAEHGA